MYIDAVFFSFLLCIIIQLGFVLYFFIKVFSLSRKHDAYTPLQRVSIIICAKNEAVNLRANLPAIFAQRYTNDAGNSLFEVIVVNDCSKDETSDVLTEFEMRYSNLTVVTVDKDEPKKYPGKKNALSKGVSAARNDILLMTDADCMPASDKWLKDMVRPFHRKKGKDIVAGYGKYVTEEGVLNSFIRWETVHSFLQMSTYAKAGKPYMAVGRNLACRRSVFLRAQDSDIWSKLPSGDDDLLIAIAGKKKNVSIVIKPTSFTVSSARQDWKSWFSQKQRHLSTGKYYRLAIKALLAKYGISHAIVWSTFIFLLFTQYWGEALGIMLMRSLIYWTVWIRMSCQLGEKKLIRFFPLFDFGWMIYNFVFSPYIFWKNKQQWT